MQNHANPMPHAMHLSKLDNKIESYLEAYAERCLTRALVFAVCGAMLIGCLVYWLTSHLPVAISLFGLLGLVGLHIGFMFFVPSAKSRKDSKRLLLEGATNPSVIANVKPGMVHFRDESGGAQVLNRIELRVWQEMVVPYLCQQHSSSLSQRGASKGRVLTASEMRYYEEERARFEREQSQLQAEVADLEAQRETILRMQQSLSEDEQALEAAKHDLQDRSDTLVAAEDMVIARLSEIEVAEAEMEQLREDLQFSQAQAASDAQAGEATIDRVALKAKEAELEALRQSLIEDKQVVEQQKTELNQLKGELIEAADRDSSGGQEPVSNLRIRETQLEAKFRELEQARTELEKRTRYVSEVENSLVDRLNSLSEREASIEQNEINAGLRRR